MLERKVKGELVQKQARARVNHRHAREVGRHVADDDVDLAALQDLRELVGDVLFAEVALQKDRPVDGSIGRMSMAMMRPFNAPVLSESLARTTCVQLPGALPRSTTVMPGANRCSRSSSSSSL